MLDYRQAERIAQSYLDKMMRWPYVPPLCFMHEHTIAKRYGWVFFYQSRAYVQAGGKIPGVAGNLPFLVDRFERRVVGLGVLWERDLAAYEAKLAPDRLSTAPELPPPDGET